MELARLKAENDRLSVRIARLEAQVIYADNLLSRAILEAFGECRKSIPNGGPKHHGRHRLSA
jgi:phage antirepressor YoqD-like protein